MTNPILTEHKTDTLHYFEDEENRYQGEYKLWYENGNLMEHTSYVDGERHGEYKRWRENGNLREHSFYVNGNTHGEYKYWYQNGNLHRHSFFVNGNTHGEYKRWCDNGNLYMHVIYVNDEETDIPIPTCEEDEFAICLEHGHMQFIR